MNRSDTASALSLAILGLVSQERLSGYDLRKIFSTTPMGHFSSSPGAIYPALGRMEREGLIEGTIEKESTLRPKKSYAITRRGRAVLRERLSKPITDDDIMWHLDELMLRFAFMGDAFGRQRSIEFLLELAARTDAYVRYLREHLRMQRDCGRVNGAYALEQGIAQYEATMRWARRVAGELNTV